MHIYIYLNINIHISMHAYCIDIHTHIYIYCDIVQYTALCKYSYMWEYHVERSWLCSSPRLRVQHTAEGQLELGTSEPKQSCRGKADPTSHCFKSQPSAFMSHAMRKYLPCRICFKKDF